MTTKPSLSHWTNPHISYDKDRGEWLGWDESGVLHCVGRDYNEVRDKLVVYEASLVPSGNDTYVST